jgi:hypothetical protein
MAAVVSCGAGLGAEEPAAPSKASGPAVPLKVQVTFGQAQPQTAAAPVLHTFRSESRLLLRDGESTQFVAPSDPVSGDRIEIDVTLQVRK